MRRQLTIGSTNSRRTPIGSPCVGLDAALNRSEPATYRWDVDTIPPGLLLTGFPEDGTVTTNGDHLVRHLAERARDPLLLPRRCGVHALRESRRLLGLLDGSHTFQVYVQDRAGNVSITGSRTWTVDAVL